MGMSASQARLLSLTARLSDLEFAAMSISNARIQLTRQTEKIAKDYTDALSNKKFVMQNTNTPLTANSLTGFNTLSPIEAQRILIDTAGRVLVSSAVANAYDNAGGSLERFLNAFGYTSLHTPPNIGGDSLPNSDGTNTIIKGFNEATTNNTNPSSNEALSINDTTPESTDRSATGNTGLGIGSGTGLGIGTGLGTGSGSGNDSNVKPPVEPKPPVNPPLPPTPPVEPPVTPPTPPVTYTYDADAVRYYTNIFNQIESNGYVTTDDQNLSNPQWLYDQLFNGNLRIEKFTATGHTQEVQWNTDKLLQETYDTSDDAAAEAKYSVETSKVQMQDKKFELEMKQIETEHKAIETELESVKKVIDKNIEHSFKIFG